MRKMNIKRDANKSRRVIDWKKINRQSKTILLIFSIFISLIFSVSYYVVYKQNGIRERVDKNSKTTNARVVSIGRGHRAEFEFFIKNEKITGSTFKFFEGEKEDQICVKYSIVDPRVNIYCEEEEKESFFNDVFKYTIQIAGIFILFYVLSLTWLIITKNKDILIEMTSRRNNNR